MRLILIALLCALMAVPLMAAPAIPDAPAVGSQVHDFTLPNLLDDNREPVTLSALLREHPLVVLVWHSIECPVVRPYDGPLPAMAAEYAERGVAFVGINSNATESDEDVIAFLRERGYNFPMLRDEGNVVADQYGAQRTPEIYVIDATMTLRYHGRIDDNAQNPTSPDLRNALNALLAGEEPPVTQTVARGCTIKRVGA